MLAIKKARIPMYKAIDDLRVEGRESIDSVHFSTVHGKSRVEIGIEADTLLLHQGIIPDIRLPLAAGCKLEWDTRQQGWKVARNIWGQSSVNQVFVAGDCAGIVGARAGELQGRLCALESAYQLHKIDLQQRDRAAKEIKSALQRHLSIRPLLDVLYAPSKAYQLPHDETLVCRCEEVYAGQIRQAARMGCVGPNQVKAFTRCGMGPCQGCLCGSTVSALVADETGATMEQVGYFRVRPPFKPITLGELADT
jgi:NADPH-dependent 2,4-dienoyl-CoA reductase/sulfur reductase-like enzyme